MRFLDKLTNKGRRRANTYAQNLARLDSLTTNKSKVEVEGYEDSWQPARPLGGNFLRHRVLGAILVLMNKANYIRWY